MNRCRSLSALALCLAASSAALAAPQIHRHPSATRTLHAARQGTQTATQNVTMPHLTYCGGRVLTSARIVAVLWGTPDALAPTTSCGASTFKDCIDGYLQDFLSNPQFDWISEYDTPAGGSNGGLHINTPTYYGIVQITPTVATGTKVGESQIESEIASQISAGNLPAPEANAQTMYEIFFPSTVNPSDPGDVACCDFCAYHDSYFSNTIGGKQIIFGIFPTAQPGGVQNVTCGSGVDSYPADCSGCGERGDWFQNLGGSISHEIFETITDPDISAGDCPNSSTTGWYDEQNSDAMSAHGEIADMCEAFNDADYSNQITEETFSAADGGSFTVQRLWSNQHDACMADDSGAFSIANSTQTTAIKAPAGSTTLISLPATSTLSAGTLPLEYALHYNSYPDAGLPSGITATIAPASPSTGENAVLSLTLSASAKTTFTFGVSAENGIDQAQTVVKISSSGITAPDAGSPGDPVGGSAGGSGGGSGGGTAGGSGGGSAGGSGGGSSGGSGGGTAGGSGGGTAGGSGGGTAGGSGGGTAGGSGGGTAGGSGGGTGGGSGTTGTLTASLSPATLAITAGRGAETTLLTVSDTAGSAQFTVATSGIPGVSASPTVGISPLTLDVSAAAGTPSGSASLTLTVQENGASTTLPLAIVVTGDDASLSVPATETVAPGSSTTFTVSSSTVQGNSQLLALSASGLPAGATMLFSPASITSGQTSTATLKADASTAISTTGIKIVGQGPIAAVQAPLSLVVGTGSSGGCNEVGAFPLALLGLAVLRRKRN